MRPSFRRCLSILALAVLPTACGGGGGGGLFGGGGGGCGAVLALGMNAAEPDEVVLQLRPGQELEPVRVANNLTLIAQFGARPIFRLRVNGADTVDAAVARLQADTTRVMFAEPNLQGQSPESRRCSVWSIGEPSVYTSQWAPDALRLDGAQALSQGTGVRVAVLDTGIDLVHPVFTGRLLPGYDFVDDDATPAESGDRNDAGFGHGTHVAGLVLLAAPQAQIMPLRVLDQMGQGNAWVLAEALAWAVDPDGDPATDDGAHVVNFSLGTLRQTKLLEIAVRIASCDLDDDDGENDLADTRFDDDRGRCAGRRGAVVFAAAGNSGSGSEVLYPAAEASLVPILGARSVTASTEARRLASFANFGSWVQIASPGEGITSTVPGGGYGVWSGTSMASPLAAGVAALVMAGGTGPDPQVYTGLRSWAPEDLALRLGNRTAALCGTTPLRQIDAQAAVTDTPAPDPAC